MANSIIYNIPTTGGPIALSKLSSYPLVSIVIGNYNYADYVGQAIESVLNQSYQNFELIVCDDGSTDNSCEVIERYAGQDHRVRLLRQTNRGQAAAWNAAYLYCKGDIICTLDADDTFYPQKLEAMIECFRRQADVGLFIHSLMIVDQDDQAIQQIPFLTKFENGWIAEQVVRRGGRWRYLPASALCFRKELAECLFPLPESSLRRTADGFVFTLGPLLTKVDCASEVLGSYRVHGKNGMGSLEVNQSTARKVISAHERVIGSVNERLSELGFEHYTLDVDRNINYTEQQFFLGLFDGKPRYRLFRKYLALISALWADDLYGKAQKILGTLVYTIALLLPTSHRSRWLTQALSYNRLKLFLQRVMRRSGHKAGKPNVEQADLPLATRSEQCKIHGPA